MTPFIIAEAGSCHDGELDRALRLINVTKAAGAHAVKFQFWSDPYKLVERLHAPEALDIYRRYQMPVSWLPRLAEAAHNEIGRASCRERV